MMLSAQRVLTIARREYRATVQRRGFWFTVIGTPLFYALLVLVVTKLSMSERVGSARRFKAFAVVDSSGVFASAPREAENDFTAQVPFPGSQEPKRETVHTQIRFYPDPEAAQKALRAGEVSQAVVFPRDYVQTGRLRRYANDNTMFSTQEDRIVSRWIVSSLFGGADAQRAQRAARPLEDSELYTLNRQGAFVLKDDKGEMLDFLMPFAFGLLLGLTFVIGGQYLLQGVNEEKESRILESMLCTITPEELLAGKLIGLGGAGLTLVISWITIGAIAGAGPAAVAVHATVQPTLLLIMLGYFVLGYLFYGSLMTGIGAIASSMREAQQFSVWFTFMLFVPFYLLPTLIGNPSSSLALTLSLLPPTAPVSTILRLTAPGSSVPPWQVAASLSILGITALIVLWVAARVFRVGMLLYGKTPNLPEIVRWVRKG
jgi:ABC-2 type transport system permease protein